MTEKVKVTQAQADWLARYETPEEIAYAIDIQPLKKRPDSPIVDWPASKVAQALYNDYEVVLEPEYKVGDWVIHTDISSSGEIAKIERIAGDIVHARKLRGLLYMWNERHIRHATPEEIKVEQERRVWAKIGRGVNEWKDGDCIVIAGDYVRINTNMGCDDEYFNNVSPKRATERKNYGDVQGVFPVESFVSFAKEGESHA